MRHALSSSPASVLAVLLGLCVAGTSFVSTPAAANEGSTPEAVAPEEQDPVPANERTPIYRERPDDPPGVPAQPVPGAAPAPVRRFGSFSSVQVNVDANGANIPGDAANEPSIAVDPTDPLHILIGWRQFDTVASNFRQAGNAYSTDGGRTWNNQPVLTPGTFRSDPVLGFDSDGNFYYSSLEGDFTVDVFRSSDGGATWGPPVFAHGGDKQWLAVDRTGSESDGFLYQSWSGLGSDDIFNRSTDGGDSFTSPTEVQNAPKWGTLDVAEDGTVYIVGSGSSQSTFYLARSTSAQNPLLTPTWTLSTFDLGGSQDYFDGPNPDGLLGQIWFAVDKSDGPTAGNLYVCCSVDPPGSDPQDVHFIRSTNGGASWSSPVKVNDDAGGSGSWQWFGTMSVSPDGRIDVVWVDTRATGDANMGQLYYSSSDDGGVNWSDDQAASAVWDSHLGWPNQNKIGDYYHMLSDRVGADLAWAATLNGEQDVYYTRIGDYDCNQNGIGDSEELAGGTATDINGNGILDECEGIVVAVEDDPAPGGSDTGTAGGHADPFSLENLPNPFKSSTTITWKMPAAGSARVQVFSVNGRAVRTLLDESSIPSGRNSVSWDGTDDTGRRVPPGIYLYQLEVDGEREARRVLVLK